MYSLCQFDQTYHSYWFLKCQVKKESRESRIPGLFSAGSVDSVCVSTSHLSADQVGQTVMGGTPWQALSFYRWQSLRFISHGT